MELIIGIKISFTTDFDGDMGKEEEEFLEKRLRVIFKKKPSLIRATKIELRKPFSSEMVIGEIEIISPDTDPSEQD